MKIAKTKLARFYLSILSLPLLLSGCAAFQVGGDIQKGRMELMYGDPKVALGYFQRAADLDPDYRLSFAIFPEGVWTYVGRANFESGMLPEARKALERARTRQEDDLAKLYLGLVLTRMGESSRGMQEIDTGLRGLAAWYDWVQFYHVEGMFWDPAKNIRKSIQTQLAALSTREANVTAMVDDLAYLGRDIEIEIDRARYQRDWYWMRRFHGDPRP